MPKVTHFEIVTKDTENVKKFYENVFNWKFNQWGDEQYWLIDTGDEITGGINGGFIKSKGENVIVNTINVSDIDLYMEKVRSCGGVITVEKSPVPGAGWICYFKDIEGNLFGMHERNENVK